MLGFSFLLVATAAAAAPPAAAPDVGASIAQVRGFAKSAGDKLWPGYGSAPFEFLLVGGDSEELFCRASAPEGFKADGIDSASGCAKHVRPRTSLPDNLLAALPIFGLPSTIVMGTPRSTGRTDAEWTRTILHEHFHEWQDSLPDIFTRMAALDLAGDDKTGMWMLNYPFPYSDPAVVSAFDQASRALGAAVDARGTPGFGAALRRYLDARTKLAHAAGARNWRYAELELWKEGVARWTEIEFGKQYPDPDVRASASTLEQKTRAWLDKPDLAGAKREFVYPFGASEAMLLESCDPTWRTRYPSALALGPLLDEAAKRCGGSD